MKKPNIFKDDGCLYIYRFARFILPYHKQLAFFIARLNQIFYGAYISPKANIGNIYITHSVGLVIGSGIKIENGCRLYHNITIGSGKNNKSNIHIKRNTTIYTNSVIVGELTIGENCIIGAGSYIDKNIKNNTKIFPKIKMVKVEK